MMYVIIIIVMPYAFADFYERRFRELPNPMWILVMGATSAVEWRLLDNSYKKNNVSKCVYFQILSYYLNLKFLVCRHHTHTHTCALVLPFWMGWRRQTRAEKPHRERDRLWPGTSCAVSGGTWIVPGNSIGLVEASPTNSISPSLTTAPSRHSRTWTTLTWGTARWLKIVIVMCVLL